jgi:hypothetical protein
MTSCSEAGAGSGVTAATGVAVLAVSGVTVGDAVGVTAGRVGKEGNAGGGSGVDAGVDAGATRWHPPAKREKRSSKRGKIQRVK